MMMPLMRRGLAAGATAVTLAAMQLAPVPAHAAAVPGPTGGFEDPGIEPGRSEDYVSVPSSPEETGSCDEMRANLRAFADAGQRLAACVESSTPSDEARAMLAGEGNSTFDIVPLPSFCTSQVSSSWFLTRTQLCRVSSRLLEVFDVQTGAVVGTMEYLQLSYQFSDPILTNWQFQLQLWPVRATGAGVAGMTVAGFANCTGDCTELYSEFPRQPVGPGVNVGGEAQFETTVPGSGPLGFSVTTWVYLWENPAWVGGVSDPVTVIPPVNLRCDNATPGQPWPGCVFPDYAPRYEMSLSGPDSAIARHVLDAQTYGLPGTGTGGSPPLHRITDTSVIDANRQKACPSSRGRPRPTGFNCDEYPFASTREGASGNDGPGRTFGWCQITDLPLRILAPDGFTACLVPEGQNSSDGSRLGSFYRDNRVIDGDAFRVWVIP